MKNIKTSEFDEKFDNDEDVSAYVDWDKAKRINESQVRVSVDFPQWMVMALDKEASHLGLSRQALIKLSVADHLKQSPFSQRL